MSRIVFWIFLFLASLLAGEVCAQNKARPKKKPVPAKAKTPNQVPKKAASPLKPVLLPDSQKTKKVSLLAKSDTVSSGDTLDFESQATKSDLDDEVKYTAEDSVIYDAAASKVYLYHNAQVEYTNLNLKAEYIEIDLVKSLAFARGKEDSTGKLQGKPVFTQGADKYVANAMTYNFKTKRAKIQGIVTQQGEGYIHGESVKKMPDNEMFINHAQYTTCNLEHPHFHIQSNKIKMIPNKKLVTGPFNIHFMDVPTPFGFGLGIFPTPQTAASGIIVPTYGEAVDRGFFLRNGGYYLHLNDYVDARFLGDIYSKGSYGFSLLANYKKRYVVNGNIDIRYNKRIAGDDALSPVGEDFWVNWNHTPETRGTSSFSASVNLGTSTFNQRNSFSPNNYLSSTFSSNVSYSKTFRGTPFNMSINARQQQDVVKKQVDIDLPTLNLNMNRIFPFKKGSSSGKSWYEKIGLAYTMALRNNISNEARTGISIPGATILKENTERLDTILPLDGKNFNTIMGRMRNGMRHTIPISTSFNMLKYVQVAPDFNYKEVWYLQRLDYNWDANRKALDVDTLRQFSRAYDFNTSLSFQTRLYGLFFVRKAGIEAIRHVLNPTIGFSYRPDLSKPQYGMMKQVQINEAGKTALLSPFSNGIFGGTPTVGETGALSFTLNNTFEMKVKNKKDTTGKEPFKKINLLDNLNIGSSYNLATDSFQLANFSISARTTLFEKLNFNLIGVVDPYSFRRPVLDEDGKVLVAQRRMPIYSWNAGKGIGQLSSFNLALSTSLNPKARDKKKLPAKAMNPQTERELEFINNNPDLYVDFNIPWNLSISYNFNYSKNGYDKAALVQSMTFSGDVNLTSKWKVGFNSGYDFINKTLVYPNINIYRDLHCWEMRFNWIPTGNRGSYSIDINVKASVLQDLKLSRRRSWFDR